MGYVVAGGIIALLGFMVGIAASIKLSTHFVGKFVSKLTPEEVAKLNSIGRMQESNKGEYAEEEQLSKGMSDEEYEAYLKELEKEV